MTTLDLIFIGIIGVTALVCGFKGLIKTVFGFASTIVSLIVAYMFYKPFAGILIRRTNIFTFLNEKISEGLDLSEMGQAISSSAERTNLLGNLQIPEFMQNMLIDNDNGEIYRMLGLDSGHSINEYISGFFANLAVNVLAFIILFVVAGIAVGILAYVLDLIAKLPVLNEVNHLAGFAIGLVMGLVLVWVISLLLYFVVTTQGTGELQATIDSSLIVPIFYNNNLFLNLLTKISGNLSL